MSVLSASQPPIAEYRAHLDRWRALHTRCEDRYRQLGNARLWTGLAAFVLAGLALGAELISPWWLIAPVVVFIALAITHERVDRERARAARGLAHFERCVGRVEARWIDTGSQGERFRNPQHLYADDLDVFGRGSLFEFLCSARTGVGESTLANWLLAPASRADAEARQKAVDELRPRVDLREELALVGEDIRVAVDHGALAKWGSHEPVSFFPGARVVAPLIAAASLTTFGLWATGVWSLRPFLGVVLVVLLFNVAIRAAVLRVLYVFATPVRDLELVGLLLERIEREPFKSPRLLELKRTLETSGVPASVNIRRLRRLFEMLDSARFHAVLRPIAAPLLWIPQFTMAIEAWRVANGPHISTWIDAVGEFEALCSLGAFSYEHPDAAFPELLETDQPQFHAIAMHHPLIAPVDSIANDLSIGGETRLMIVSGSNMSGKSTMMRAVGLNAVLAWAGAPVTCTQLRISPLNIGASLRTNDSLADHRSRFYAEIQRLREIVDLAQSGRPTLFLLDELLSGTNSHDRRIGAEALVRGLVGRGAIGLITTHDLALAHIAETLTPPGVNVHFEDHIEGGEIRFDYRLRPGVVTRSNALELMRAVGLDV